ncbi:hypothetical protein MmiHf6_06080 [Methanimicrococcus hongohii]|uniref:VWFA domain-containing protein n=1 Tax=Methanimicrococcus hongohii TaxID=3028295 RepID=A0AA97A1J5_9EURY|nr:hypothetical protein [Methanimicrococcus sp. Hf6]WNY23303.1 hypothetical protein MmiHf6_06080 [Methanimicrococcus sp. Hf6]
MKYLKNLSCAFILLILAVSMMNPIAFAATPYVYYHSVVIQDATKDPYINADLVQFVDVYNFSDKTFQDVYIFIDVSDSASAWSVNAKPIISNFKTSAVNIIDNDYFNNTNITYFTIGDTGRSDKGTFYYVGKSREATALKTEIINLKTGDGQTDIINTFNNAIPVMENRSNKPLIIILSDGNLVSHITYNELLSATNQVAEYDATILFMNLYTNGSKRPNWFNDSGGNIYAQKLMRNYKGEGIYVESSYGLPIDFIFHSSEYNEVLNETLNETVTAPVLDATSQTDGFDNSVPENSEPENKTSFSNESNNYLLYIFMAAMVVIMLFILRELYLLRKRREN